MATGAYSPIWKTEGLTDEDYEKKLKKANATEEGLENLRKIGDYFGIEKSEKNNLFYNW